MPPRQDYPKLVHRLSLAAVAAALLLVIAGGLVTSRNAGLAVPDWPLSYGTLNPPRWWAIENVRTEHGHRLIAACVALLTLAMAAAARLRPCPARVRTLTTWAAALVLVQAPLGGLRVLAMSLDLAMVHGVVAQIYFVVLVLAAVASSPSAVRTARGAMPAVAGHLAELLTVIVAVQLVAGIVIRHLGPAARPLADNRLFYMHLTIGLAIFTLAVQLRRHLEDWSEPERWHRLARGLPVLVGTQIALGVMTWLVTERMTGDLAASPWQAWLPTLHVALGAAVFSTVATLAALPRIQSLRAGRELERLETAEVTH